MRNGTHVNHEQVNHSKAAEFAAYDTLHPEERRVLREAPFDVSVVDLLRFERAMERRRSMAPTQFADWLEDQLLQAYRRKFC